MTLKLDVGACDDVRQLTFRLASHFESVKVVASGVVVLLDHKMIVEESGRRFRDKMKSLSDELMGARPDSARLTVGLKEEQACFFVPGDVIKALGDLGIDVNVDIYSHVEE